MFLLIFTNKKNKLILPIIVSYKYTYMYVTIRYLVSYAYLIIKFPVPIQIAGVTTFTREYL